MRRIIVSMLLGAAILSFLEWLVTGIPETLHIPYVQLSLFLLTILLILIAGTVAAPFARSSK